MSRGTSDDIDPFDPTEFVESAPSAPTSEPAFELGPGTVVGDYEIEGKVGEGGMGIVYSAIHPVIGKRAAIKVLKRELCTDRTELARFIDEARAVNKIGHPNIVDIFTLGQLPDGRSYLVMEWLAGETLRTRLLRGRPDLDETCYVLRSLARALDAAHEKGIVHRDLKPDNVFLVAVRGDRPMVKLLDFGIAKLLHPDQRIDRTATNQMMGTPLYVAPEQARAEPIDQQADIYALGAMTFEMIAGQPPFLGKTAMEVIAKHMLEPAPRLSTRLQGLPAELDQLIAAMLDKQPANRPRLADFTAVLDRLAPVLRSADIRDLGPVPQQRMTAYSMSPNTPNYAMTMTPSPMTAASMPVSMSATAGEGAFTMAPTSPGVGPRRRRSIVPVLGGMACVAGGVVAFVLMRGDGDTTTEPTAKPADTTPTEAKPEPPKPEPKAEAKPEAVAQPEPPKQEPKQETKEPVKKAPDPRIRKVLKPRVRTKTTNDDDVILAPGAIPRGGGKQ